MMTVAICLLIAFQIKHFLADFPLQGKYMLGKFKSGTEWILPLAAHSLVHAGLTFVICAIVSREFLFALGMATFDFTVHFSVDRIKASPKLLGRFKALSPEHYKTIVNHPNLGSTIHGDGKWVRNRDLIRGNTYFWWSLGADQMAHHLTHYAIIVVLLERSP